MATRRRRLYTSRTTDLRAQVFLLEGDLQPKIRRAMLGRDVDMPHVSNSYFSARALVTYPERRKQLPPTDHYKQRFLDANCADLSFYYTLVNKLRADKMCKGCSPPPPVWNHGRRVDGVGRLKFDFHTGRRTGSSAGTRATRGRGASTSTRSSPTRRSGRR